MALRRVFGVVRAGAGWVRLVLYNFALPTLTLAFLAGVVVTAGSRLVAARMINVNTGRLRLSTAFGGEMPIEGDMTVQQRMAMTFVPSAIACAVGLVLLLPFLIDLTLLGVPIVTAFGWITGEAPRSASDSALGQLLAWYEPEELFALWVGFSCWYCCAPKAAEVRDARSALRRRRRKRAAAAVATLGVVYAVARIFEIFDEAMMWLGANLFIASGLASVVLLTASVRLVLRALI